LLEQPAALGPGQDARPVVQPPAHAERPATDGERPYLVAVPLHLVEHPLQPVEEAVPAARVLAVAQLHAERLAIGAFERQLRLARPDPPARDQALRKGPDDPDQVERDFHFRSLACSGSLPQSTAPP